MRRPIPAPAGDRRYAAQFIYRILTLAAIPFGVLSVMPNQWINSSGFYTWYAVAVYSIPLVFLPLLAVLAVIGSVAFRRDWRFALPAWIYLVAMGMALADLFVFRSQAGLLLPAFYMFGASLLVAIWPGWWLRLEPPPQSN